MFGFFFFFFLVVAEYIFLFYFYADTAAVVTGKLVYICIVYTFGTMG